MISSGLHAGPIEKHKSQEKAVLNEADRVVAVGKTMAERFSLTQGIRPVVVPNGFDEADFQVPLISPAKQFSIVHVGAMNRDRNHSAFWEAIAELVKEKPGLMSNLVIKLVGKLDVSVHQSIAKYELQDLVEIEDYLPHDQVIPLLLSASILYLPINHTPNAKSIQTGKIFEYLAAGRNILGTGPEDGDAADILKECQAGEMVGFTDKPRLKAVLTEWAELHREGKLVIEPSGTEIYSRRHLTSIIAAQLEEITGT